MYRGGGQGKLTLFSEEEKNSDKSNIQSSMESQFNILSAYLNQRPSVKGLHLQGISMGEYF